MKILDFGCGHKKIKVRGATVVGVDLSENADVQHDLNRFPYPFNDDEFDQINVSHVIEHLDDLPGVIKELHRITKNGGLIRIRAPHFSSWAAWIDPTHKRGICSSTFDYFHPENNYNGNTLFRGMGLVAVKKRLRWAGSMGSSSQNVAIRAFGKVVDAVANANVKFCERLWCYWVGGFGEVEILLKVVKKQGRKKR